MSGWQPSGCCSVPEIVEVLAGLVGLVEADKFDIGQGDVECPDGVAEVVWLGQPTMGAATMGFFITQASATCARLTPRSDAIAATASTIALSADSPYRPPASHRCRTGPSERPSCE